VSGVKKKPTRAKLVRQQVFLQTYAVCGNITQAAQAAKLEPGAHYNWLKDPEYAEAFRKAQDEATDLLVGEARRRAIEGDSEPAIYQGALCYERLPNGKKRQIVINRKSDVLLIFLLKAMRPEIFRDNWKGEIRHTGSISSGPDLSNLTDDQLQQLNRMLELANGSSSPVEGIVVGSAGGTGEEET
jgi:hypothetical protein